MTSAWLALRNIAHSIITVRGGFITRLLLTLMISSAHSAKNRNKGARKSSGNTDLPLVNYAPHTHSHVPQELFNLTPTPNYFFWESWMTNTQPVYTIPWPSNVTHLGSYHPSILQGMNEGWPVTRSGCSNAGV